MEDEMRNIPVKIKKIENHMDRVSKRQIRNMLYMSEIADQLGWTRKTHLVNEYHELEEDSKLLQKRYNKLLNKRKQLRNKLKNFPRARLH